MSKLLKTVGKQITCDKCMKGKDYIYPLDVQGNQIAQFEGISDFSGYSLVDEKGNQIDFDTPELTEGETLAQSVAKLSISNAQKDIQVQNLTQTIANLNIDNSKKDAQIQSLVQTMATLSNTVAQLQTKIEGGATNV